MIGQVNSLFGGENKASLYALIIFYGQLFMAHCTQGANTFLVEFRWCAVYTELQ